MRLTVSIVASALGFMLAAVIPSIAQGQAQMPATKEQTKPICANCHEEKWHSIDLTGHGARNDANGTMCQNCHGDATEHLKDPLKAKPANPFAKGKPASEQAAVCLTCHSGNRNLAFWTAGKHALNEVACSNCHSIHGEKVLPTYNGVNLVAQKVTINKFTTTFQPNQSEICGTCHQHIRAETFKPSHHPIIEGKIKCSDCHNPHGALSPVMVKQPTINDQCYSCHTDKRGPFVFNHPPVEENCATCHNPHGSVHYKLLREHTPNLCQDCHESSRHPGTIYGAGGGFTCQAGMTNDQINYPGCFGKPIGSLSAQVNTRLVDRACVNCHVQLHGSNAPANRGQFFLR
jgi:DmsE family decaheme c-type cytochrome